MDKQPQKPTTPPKNTMGDYYWDRAFRQKDDAHDDQQQHIEPLTLSDAEKFEAAFDQWADHVQREIRNRSQPDQSKAVLEYNQHVVFGLKIAYGIMIEAMKKQIETAAEVIE